MVLSRILTVSCLLALLVITPITSEEVAAAAADSPEGVEADGPRIASNEDGKFLFGAFSTTTFTIVQPSTSTVFFTCNGGTSATVCAGRRKRRFARNIPRVAKSIDLDGTDGKVDSSLDSSGGETPVEVVSPEDREKFGFTIWTTSRTTTSVTVFFTNTSTTVRISFNCVAGGMALPARNCG